MPLEDVTTHVDLSRQEGAGTQRSRMQAGSEGWKGFPMEEMHMGMTIVGIACRTTSSDVKSSSRKTRPVQAEATFD
jgi:hypothetical protein